MRIMYLFFTIVSFCFSASVNSQSVAINSDGSAPHSSAMLHVKSANKGVLIPTVSLTGTNDVTTIASPAWSLMIYNAATAGAGTTAVVPGFYYWNGVAWTPISFTTNSEITGNNDFLAKGSNGHVARKKGYGTLGLNYIICIQGNFPCTNPPCPGDNLETAMAGEIRLFAGPSAPYNWAFCDGALLSISAYTNLFIVIGTTYGGNGQTNFALPDLRSAVPVNVGTSTTGQIWELGEKRD